jgi:hypothetical protein
VAGSEKPTTNGLTASQEILVKKKSRKVAKTSKKYLEPLKSPRPRKTEAGIVFSLRMSATELEQLRDLANAEGLPVSDLIRRRLFRSPLPFDGAQSVTDTTAVRAVFQYRDDSTTA